MSRSLASKRNKSLWLIIGTAIGSGAASGAPTPVVELAKQIGIGAADVIMCLKIYEIYNEEKLTLADLRESLSVAGWVVAGGGALAYGGVKLTEGLIAEATNILGPLGWGFSAAITSSVTSVVGILWLMFVHSSYVSRAAALRPA